MEKSEWGTKRECLNCGARYYDLQRDPIICPKCESAYEPEPAKGRLRVVPQDEAPAPVVPEVVAKPAETEAEAVDQVAVEGEDAAAKSDDDLVEDSSELGENAVDVVVAIEDKPEKGPE